MRAERENIMKKALKIILGAALAVYVLALVYILFLRGRGNVYDQAQPLSEYAKYAVNLIPFETINGFWRALRENRINTDIALFNIFGNIALFVPFGFLIPCLEKKLRLCGSAPPFRLLLYLPWKHSSSFSKSAVLMWMILY